MTKLAAEARFCLATFERPADVVNRLNQLLCDDGVEDRFVTMVMTVLKTNTGEMTVVNAGHYAPMRATKAVRLAEIAPEIAGIPLGVSDDFEYQQADVKLAEGDLIALVYRRHRRSHESGGSQYGSERFRTRMSSNYPTLENSARN